MSFNKSVLGSNCYTSGKPVSEQRKIIPKANPMEFTLTMVKTTQYIF